MIHNYTLNTLGNLCYTKDTAVEATGLIYKLAMTECEFQNDAKISFVNLFQAVLAQTVLDFDQRIIILDELGKEGITEVLLQAYHRILKSHSFIGRIYSGNEKVKEVFHSNSVKVTHKYFIASIHKLTEIYNSKESPYSELAKDALFNMVSNQILYGAYEEIIKAIDSILSDGDGEIDARLRQNLMELKSDRHHLPDDKLNLINIFLEKYEPKSTEEELKSIVIEAPWINEKDEHGNLINISSEKAKELADRYVNDDINWQTFLDLLINGEQRQTYSFSERIGQSDIDKKSLMDLLISRYRAIPIKLQNPVFIYGLLNGVDDDNFTRETINKLILYKETEALGIRPLRILKPITYDDLLKIRPLLNANPDYLKQIEYLELNDLSDEEVINITSWLKEIDLSFSLHILYNILRKESRWDALKNIINDLLFTEDILEKKSFLINRLHIEDLLVKSINDNSSAENIEFLLNQIIEKYDDYNYNDQSMLNSLNYFLLSDHWEKSWPIIGNYFLKDSNRNSNLKYFLDKFNFDHEQLYIWSLGNIKSYPAIAIRFMNIFKRNEQGILGWDEVAKRMIDQFGNNENVLKNISHKISNFTIYSASAEHLYAERKLLIEQLVNHHFEEVRLFAKKQLEYLSQGIAREKRFGENYELGY